MSKRDLIRLPRHTEDKSSFDLDEEIQEDIIQAIRLGGQIVPAARYAGVTEHQVMDWLSKAENDVPGGKYFEFRKKVQQAEARTELGMISHIRRHAKDDWRAAAWWLEKTHKTRYGKTSQVDHVLSGKAEVTVTELEQWPVEQRKQLFRYMRAVQQLSDGHQVPLDSVGDLKHGAYDKCVPPDIDPDDVIDIED